MLKRSLSALIAFMTVFALSGCGANSDTQVDMGGIDMSMSEPAIGNGSVESKSYSQSIIRSAELTIETNDVNKVYDQAKSTVESFGGRIESSSFQEAGSGYGPSAFLTIRIAENKLDLAIEEFSSLGKQSSLSVNSYDVTLQTIDLEARVKSLTESRDRLQTLLDEATSTSELITGEQALASLQSELDSYQSQLDYLKTQVSESTIYLQITSDRSSITSGLNGLKETLLNAARGFLEAFEKAFVFIITAIPWLIIIGIFTLIGRLIYRPISKKFKK